jgi:transposase InsO family protein
MKLHANARLSVKGRALLIDRIENAGWSVMTAASAAGISDRTARKWLARWRAGGQRGLLDRSSAPKTIPHRTTPERVAAIESLRRIRMTSTEIAEVLEMPRSTVSAVLKRIGLGKLSRLDPLEPPNRYERRHPGELVHVDVKKLGRIAPGGAGHRAHGRRQLQRPKVRRDKDGHDRNQTGWEYVHVCIDDTTRLAYAEVLTDEKSVTAAAFLRRAAVFYARHGIRLQRVMTDNGGAYRGTAHALACRDLGLRHIFTRPYRPRTNGKAERFIKTMTAGWAYGAIYGSSQERTTALDGWLWTYNHRRTHSAIGHKTPAARLNELNNQPGLYI